MSTPASQPHGGLLLERRDRVYADDLLICAIAELDLFTLLAATPLTLDQLCEQEGLERRPARVLVTLCRALGLLERSETGTLSVAPAAACCLVAGAPGDLRAYYASLRRRPAVGELLEVLRTGRAAAWASNTQGVGWESTLDDPQQAGELTAAMDARGRLLGPALAQTLDLEPFAHVLDIAGGSGIYASALLDRWPHLRATLLERSPVDRAARALSKQRGDDGRLTVLTGDMLTGPLPPGADVHLFSHVLHDWDEIVVRRLLAASFEALPPGGLLIDLDAHLDPDEGGPLEVAEYSVLLCHSTQGRCYSVTELADWLGEAGFQDVRVLPVLAGRTAVLATKRTVEIG